MGMTVTVREAPYTACRGQSGQQEDPSGDEKLLCILKQEMNPCCWNLEATAVKRSLLENLCGYLLTQKRLGGEKGQNRNDKNRYGTGGGGVVSGTGGHHAHHIGNVTRSGFGIDVSFWNIREWFRGVKMIPPSVHIVYSGLCRCLQQPAVCTHTETDIFAGRKCCVL
ncbi:uncharacterized protein LOC135106611 isoform X1 [Scylla paramamosain]|uniref:uncharacterized protein LOC135106611 isoform X1 n=1 Tax=Scylla paramamosain TaxID=85552 RepID=UPI003082A511